MTRSRRTLLLTALLIGVGLAVGLPALVKRSWKIEEGGAPPPLVASGWLNTQGRALELEDLRGKVVLVEFWATW